MIEISGLKYSIFKKNDLENLIRLIEVIRAAMFIPLLHIIVLIFYLFKLFLSLVTMLAIILLDGYPQLISTHKFAKKNYYN